MTPAEHYVEAERLLALAERAQGDPELSARSYENRIWRTTALNALYARAQVHATLALYPVPAEGGGPQ